VIDLKSLRETPDAVRAALARRGDSSLSALLDELAKLDVDRRTSIAKVEALKARRNEASQEVAAAKKKGADASSLLTEAKTVSDQIAALDAALREVEAEIERKLLFVPNLPLPDLPDGDASQNRLLRSWGTPKPQGGPPHWETGERLGLFDLPRGARLSGSGFPVLVGAGARLARGLINFMLDLHTREHGYREVEPPFLVRRDMMVGTGQLPKFEDEAYRTEDDLFLIPTAEVPLTNLHRDEILEGTALPLAYTAYTPCFRREAGAAGKDTRGLLRVHQFDKVELVRFTRPEDSAAEHERLTAHAEETFRRLELPYRVMLLAAGDLGFASAKTYDLEVWAPGVGAWLECSSSSTFTEFQARRANIRYRPGSGEKPKFVHTLNASGVALPRTIAALLEVHLQPDGSVRVPPALAPYVGTEKLSG
jgi:seryl-tRNA synthetase